MIEIKMNVFAIKIWKVALAFILNIQTYSISSYLNNNSCPYYVYIHLPINLMDLMEMRNDIMVFAGKIK